MLKEILLRKLNTKSKTVNNAIITLGDTDDTGKGRHFKSRFIQPGLAGYPGQYGNALIRKENLDKFIYTLKNKPVIINHKDNIGEDDKVGEVFNVWFNPDDGWYWCDGVITDKTAQNLVENKKWSVSCSYDFTKYNDEGGEENGIPYDIEFLDGEFAHLAIVDNPRYERANIVFNSKTGKDKGMEINNDEKGKWMGDGYIVATSGLAQKHKLTEVYPIDRSKADNSKEQDMAIIEELKKLITKVENDKGDKDMVNNEKEDKRKLIDEVGGILKGKVDDEIIRTIIKKMEEASYNESEAGSADNKKVKNEADEEDKKDEEKVENKKVKNEETEEDKEKVEELKEDEKKDVENKCNNSKETFFDKMNKIYNSSVDQPKNDSYISRADRLKAGEDYFKV